MKGVNYVRFPILFRVYSMLTLTGFPGVCELAFSLVIVLE